KQRKQSRKAQIFNLETLIHLYKNLRSQRVFIMELQSKKWIERQDPKKERVQQLCILSQILTTD
ncbi:MAG: hypothetical protein EZS28_038811, partial [Streblomastix strix]